MNQRWMISGLAVGLLAAAVGGWYYWSPGLSPKVVEAQELGKQLFQQNNGLTPEQRREQFQQFRQAIEQLSPEERRQMWQNREGGGGFRERMDQQMNAYFALSPPDRVAFLDRQIDEREKRRKEFAQMRGDGQRGDGQRGGWGRGGGDRDGRGWGGGGNRDDRRRRRLDGTTPKQRAQWTAYRKAMEARRRERGLAGGRG